MKKPRVMTTFDQLGETSAETEVKVDRDRVQADARADVMFAGVQIVSQATNKCSRS